jgi:GNAT superfamily N-acetyltransferase
MIHRVATDHDIDAVSATIALAFRDDPVWGPALERPDGSTAHLAEFWRYFVEGPVSYGTVWVAEDPDSADIAASVAVWIPPGGSEMSDEQAGQVAALVESTLSTLQAVAFAELSDRFEANHPHDVPHAYLSLLATHPAHRGKGIGQQLLADNLRRWDDQGMAAYLESTNPGNNHRYERAGFRRTGEFRAPLNDVPIATMWRDALPVRDAPDHLQS